MSARGFDMAGAIVPGTVIERVYFAVPVHGTTGDPFDTMADALRAAIERGEEQASRRLLAEHGIKPVVDVRWFMRVPEGTKPNEGGSQDTVAERFTYDTIDEARQHLARIEKYAGV
jgi:hypothetical protein